MDRFIAVFRLGYSFIYWCLKSNMDRFIEIPITSQFFDFLCLKSNMDRFIAQYGISSLILETKFKIQYG